MANYYGQTRQAYGLGQSLQGIFPAPIVTAGLNPTVNDHAEIGQIWVNTQSGTFQVLVSDVAGTATWLPVSTATGAITGTTLTITPGPTSITGAITLPSLVNGVLLTSATGLVTATSAALGTMLMGRGAGVTPSFGALTSTGGTISISVVGNTINLEQSGSLSPFNNVIASPTLLAANNGYIVNFAGVATLNLPATAVVGQTIEIIQVDRTVGRGFQIALNGNTLRYGGESPTTLTFTNRAAPNANYHGSIYLVSIAANTWAVFGMPLGNFTVA